MIDNFNRQFKYLRLSLTEKCNFRCSYCLPNGYTGCATTKYLNLSEIKNLATGFQELGIEKIRLTGGEPSLRFDLIDIVQTLKNDVGIAHVAMTTNAFQLEKSLNDLKQAGLDALNISLDSLQPENFKRICGIDRCEKIKISIDRAIDLGIKKIKINAVLLKNLNDDEFLSFIEWIADRPVTFRFIELMRTTDNQDYFNRHHMSVSLLEDQLQHLGWRSAKQDKISGPAIEYSHPNSLGKFGFISAYRKDFCASCNRLRVSSTGGLRLCLFGEGDLPLRHLLQDADQKEELKYKIQTALGLKPLAHRLHEGYSGNMYSLSAIGG